MKNTQPTSPTRVRLYSYVTKTRFLHVEDALSIGKVRLFAGTYSRGQGMSGHTSHYLDLADARIVFHALLNGEQDFTYKEYKDTPPPTPKQAAVSRVLSVVVKGGNVYMEFKSGPGQLAATGAITPNGRAETEVNVSFKQHEARRLASEVLAYIHAWDVYRIMTFRQVVGNPPAYLLTPATGESDEPVAANQTGKNLSPRKIMVDTRDRLEEVGRNIDKNKGVFVPDNVSLLNDYISAEELWACTSCNACVEECPVNISPLSIIIDMRRYLVMEQSAAPTELNGMFSKIENNQAPWQFSPADRLNWVNPS